MLIFRDGEASARPPYASLRWQQVDHRAAMATIALPGLSDCDWSRSVILLPGSGFLVVDTITADRAGPVEAHTLWRTVGRTEHAADHDQWTMIMGEERLRLLTAPPEGGWRTEQAAEPYRRTNWPDYPYAEAEVTVLRQVSSGDLAAGESRTAVHLLVDGPGDAAIDRDGDLVHLTLGDRHLALDLAALAAGDGPGVISDRVSRRESLRSLSLSKGQADQPGPSTGSGNENPNVPTDQTPRTTLNRPALRRAQGTRSPASPSVGSSIMGVSPRAWSPT